MSVLLAVLALLVRYAHVRYPGGQQPQFRDTVDRLPAAIGWQLVQRLLATVPMLAISNGPVRSVGELPRLRSALFFRTADGLLRRTFRCTQATSSSIGSMHSSVSFFTLLTARLTA
jgi:hypothetical protein